MIQNGKSEIIQDETQASATEQPSPSSGLHALCGIAAYYRIAADPAYLQRELALAAGEVRSEDILRAARLVGLKARKSTGIDEKRLKTLPSPE